jgi:hypothetical protein
MYPVYKHDYFLVVQSPTTVHCCPQIDEHSLGTVNCASCACLPIGIAQKSDEPRMLFANQYTRYDNLNLLLVASER